MLKLLTALFCVLLASSAYADGVAFPPEGCSAGNPFMAFNGVNDPSNKNTYCSNGQSVLQNALPACAAGQQVAYDGGKFICKDAANVPTCNPSEFLSFDGQTYQCKSTGVATCGNNQVLTFNGSSYFCVNKDATIPVCGAGQFLTYNGAYQCASVNTPSIPTCGATQVLTASNGQLSCVDAPDTNRFGGIYTMNMDGTCRYGNPLTGACSCPSGFWASQFHEFFAGGCAYYQDDGSHPVCGIVEFQCVR